MKLTCKEASRLLSLGLEHKLTLGQRTALRLHLTLCDACTNVRAQFDFCDERSRATPEALTIAVSRRETINSAYAPLTPRDVDANNESAAAPSISSTPIIVSTAVISYSAFFSTTRRPSFW